MQEDMEEENVNTPQLQETKSQSFWELIRFAVFVLIIVIPVRMYIAQPFIVSGSSMHPTFENGQYLIIDEISLRTKELKRNQVVVFKYPRDPEKYFIKRIIGLPNETVDVIGDKVTITNKEYPQGFELEQPYIERNSKDFDPKHLTLRDQEYFVMGDNRSASSDSRYWGAVHKEELIGKVLIRLFPLTKIDLWPGENY